MEIPILQKPNSIVYYHFPDQKKRKIFYSLNLLKQIYGLVLQTLFWQVSSCHYYTKVMLLLLYRNKLGAFLLNDDRVGPNQKRAKQYLYTQCSKSLSFTPSLWSKTILIPKQKRFKMSPFICTGIKHDNSVFGLTKIS